MRGARRFVTMTGILMQGYAFYALLSGSLVWPIIWPSKPALYAVTSLLWMSGYCVINFMLTDSVSRCVLVSGQIIPSCNEVVINRVDLVIGQCGQVSAGDPQH